MEIERTGTRRTAEGIVTKKSNLGRGIVERQYETWLRKEKWQKCGTGARERSQRKMGVNFRAMSIRRMYVQGDRIMVMRCMHQ